MESERQPCKQCGEFSYGNQSGFCSDHCVTAYAAEQIRSQESFSRELREQSNVLIKLQQDVIERLRSDCKDMRETIERQNAIIQGADADELKLYQQRIRSKDARIDEQGDEILKLEDEVKTLRDLLCVYSALGGQ